MRKPRDPRTGRFVRATAPHLLAHQRVERDQDQPVWMLETGIGMLVLAFLLGLLAFLV